MKIIVETISGRKGIKNFKNEKEFVKFMSENEKKITSIKECDLPYMDKPVELVKPTKSNGWAQIDSSLLGSMTKDAHSEDSMLQHTNGESYLTTQSTRKKSDQETNSSNDNKFLKKEEKSDENENDTKIEKEIEECLRNAGVYLNESMEDGETFVISIYDRNYRDYKEYVENIEGKTKFTSKIEDAYHFNSEEEAEDYAKKLQILNVIGDWSISGGVKSNESGELDEDTVYDHSWYETNGGEYPERSKEGVNINKTHKTGKNNKNPFMENDKDEWDSSNETFELEEGKIKDWAKGAAMGAAMGAGLIPGVKAIADNQPKEPTRIERSVEDNSIESKIKKAHEAGDISLNDKYNAKIQKIKKVGDNEYKIIYDVKAGQNLVNGLEATATSTDGKTFTINVQKMQPQTVSLNESPMSDEEMTDLKKGDKINWDLSSDDFEIEDIKGDNYSLKRIETGGRLPDNKSSYVKKHFSKEAQTPKDSLAYAERQVEVWKDALLRSEYLDNYSQYKREHDDAEQNLKYWADKVSELSNNEVNESEMLDETKPARYNQHLGKEKSFANISASRSNDELEEPNMRKEKQQQSALNNSKTAQLKKDIKDLGLSYIKTYGAWRDEGPSTQENSFLIPNISKEKALELGKKYRQYSVIHKDNGSDTAYMYITLDNEDFGKPDMSFDMSDKAKFSQVKKSKDELDPYSGYTGLKSGGKGYNLSYKAK